MDYVFKRCHTGTEVKGVESMGRGRQKAKQTKVARELKYYSPQTDYRALERELVHGEPGFGLPRTGSTGVIDEVEDTSDDNEDDDDWEPTSGR